MRTKPGEDQETQWIIVLTDETVGPAVQWFHPVLGHPGQQRPPWTMQARYYHPSMRRQIKQLNCDACQRYKHDGPAYGHMPPRDTNMSNWYEVAVDCIGPWKVDIRNKTRTKRSRQEKWNSSEIKGAMDRTVYHFQSSR